MLNEKTKKFFRNSPGYGGVQDDHIPFLAKSKLR